jgi:hypothetical protein
VREQRVVAGRARRPVDALLVDEAARESASAEKRPWTSDELRAPLAAPLRRLTKTSNVQDERPSC